MFYKYQKYKKKYIEIKNQIGGECVDSPDDNNITLDKKYSFKDLNFKSSTTNMHDDKICYSAKDAATWIYDKSKENTSTNFPYISIPDITLLGEHLISINQIWYIIVNNNNNFKELHNMIEQHNYQCNDYEKTIKDSQTFLYTQNQKEYIEKWLRLLKTHDMFIYSLNGIKEWLNEQISKNIDKFKKIINEAKSLNIILDETRERIYYTENQDPIYHEKLVNYNNALHEYNALESTHKHPIRIDTDVTDETPNSSILLNYINNKRTSNDIKSEINARIYSNIKKVGNHTVEYDFSNFGFSRSPLLNKGYTTYDEQHSQNEIQIAFWQSIPTDSREIHLKLSISSLKLIDYIDPINKRLDCIKSILEFDDYHPDEYLRTYDDDIIFRLLDDTQKNNRRIFITCMMEHFDNTSVNRWNGKTFEKFITGLYYELLYFKIWADSNNIKYNLLTWRLHLYKIANNHKHLIESVKYIHSILSYKIGNTDQVIAFDNFYDVLFLIFIFGYFPYDPLIQFKGIWSQIEYTNTPIENPNTPIENLSDILHNNKMETLPQSNITYEIKSLKNYLAATLDNDIVYPEEYIHLISGLYFVILEISNIILNYNNYKHSELYCTSNDDNKLIMQTHKSDAVKNPVQQLDTTYLDLLKTILDILLEYTQLSTFTKKSIEELHEFITSIIENIKLFRYNSAKEYIASKKSNLLSLLYILIYTFELNEIPDDVINEDIIKRIVVEIFKYLKTNNIIDT